MKITIDVSGLAQVKDVLSGFSDRRLRAVEATTLTRSARELAGGWTGELFATIDRPTAATINSVGVATATADKPLAEVFIKDRAVRPGAPSPAEWLAPQEGGGDRFVKKFERALIAQGSMPAGMRVVPSKFAEIDGFGNISRGQIVQVIAQLGAQFSPGYQRVIGKSAAKRAASAMRRGRNYVAILARDSEGRAPGVYEIAKYGLKPIFYYVSRMQYRKRTGLQSLAKSDAPAILRREAERAINEHIARLEAKAKR